MFKYGNLTKSKMLYEGNWDTWKKHILDVIDSHYAAMYTPQELRQFPGIATFIRRHVSPALLARVPYKARNNISQLWKELKALAVPFRLLDLPAELRIEVYRHAIGPFSTASYRPLQIRRMLYVPITLVSRAVRREALPIFYSQTRFLFDFIYDIEPSRNAVRREIRYPVADTVQSWMRSRLPAHLRFLTHVALRVRAGARHHALHLPTIVQFTFSGKDGLRVTYLPNLSEGTKNELDRHAAIVEQMRQTLGLRGEAIVMAILNNPRMWKYRHLKRS